MAQLQIEQIPVLSDNYVYLLHEPRGRHDRRRRSRPWPRRCSSGCSAHGWRLDWILSTHHHADHTGGNLELKQATGCRIVGPEGGRGAHSRASISAWSRATGFELGDAEAEVFETPGHTSGHISYWFAERQGAVLRRHAVLARLRPGVRGHARADVALALASSRRCPTTRWSTARTSTPGERALRADASTPTTRRSRRAPPRSTGSARPASRRCRPRSAPSARPTRSCARTTRRSASASAWRTPATPRCSPRSASARTASEAQRI